MANELYENENLSPHEESVSTKRALIELLPLLKNHKRPLIYCFALLAVATILSLFWPVLLKRALDIDIKNGDIRSLIWTVAGIGAIQAVTLVLQYIQRIKLETIGQDIMVELKGKLFKHILSLDIAFFDANPVGRLLARIESDTESLRMLFTNAVVMLVGDLILVVGVFGIMFYYSWRLAVILLAVVPVMAVLIYVFERLTTPRFYAVRKKVALISASLAEFLHGISVIQIFNRESYAQKRVDDANRNKFVDDVYVNIAVCTFFNLVFLLQYLMIGIVLYLGAIWISSGAITFGIISMFIILIWRVFEPIYRTSEQLSVIQRAGAGARRIFALLSNDQKLPDAAEPVQLATLKKGIRFEHVWFSYNGDDNYILRDVTFEIPVGKQIALAGVTGGGKTTIISLLLRFYDPQKGQITVDGIDIRNIAKAELRRRFALVLQDIYLFPGSIKSNIALESEEIPSEQIIKAAQMVNADQFINRLPKGYDCELSEKGANLSRGERQLLSFARALVTNPEVLLLDEATSSVDPETERTIQSALKTLMAGRTSLVIAHRLTTILEVDEILVMRKGEIIERGTHADLLLQNGYYSKLFHLQYKSRNGELSYAK
jgi:ATP-binding cassette, subfamily B, multidrug efflux pump